MRKPLALHVNGPLLLVEAKSLQGALLAEPLGLVDELVAAVVASSRIALGVFICDALLSAY